MKLYWIDDDPDLEDAEFPWELLTTLLESPGGDGGLTAAGDS